MKFLTKKTLVILSTSVDGF